MRDVGLGEVEMIEFGEVGECIGIVLCFYDCYGCEGDQCFKVEDGYVGECLVVLVGKCE